MKLDDEKLKRILQDDMNKEAEQILEAVENDPIAKDAVAPEGIYERLMKQIEEKEAEEQKANDESLLTAEQKELIRLGKIYKKKRSRRKYYVVGIAAVVAMAIGLTSFGGAKKVFTEVKRFVSGKEQVVTNTNDGNFDEEISSEEEAYQAIEDKFGFYPVRMYYLPEGMDFVEATVEEEKQLAFMHYADEKDRSISYCVVTNYRTSSVGVDIEDDVIQTYEKEIRGLTIHFEVYSVEENKDKRWKVRFEYEDAQYTLLFMGIDESEVNRIIEKLEIF